MLSLAAGETHVTKRAFVYIRPSDKCIACTCPVSDGAQLWRGSRTTKIRVFGLAKYCRGGLYLFHSERRGTPSRTAMRQASASRLEVAFRKSLSYSLQNLPGNQRCAHSVCDEFSNDRVCPASSEVSLFRKKTQRSLKYLGNPLRLL